MSVRIFGHDGSVIAEIQSVERVGDELVFRSKLLGNMRVKMWFRPEEIGNALRIALNWGVISYVLALPYIVVKRAFQKYWKFFKAHF